MFTAEKNKESAFVLSIFLSRNRHIWYNKKRFWIRAMAGC